MIQSQTFLSLPKHHNPFSAYLQGVHQCPHEVHCTTLSIAVQGLGMLHYTLIPSHCIQVNTERLLFKLSNGTNFEVQIDK